MRVGRPRIAFLMAAHADAAAAGTTDVAGRQRHVHQRAVGAVIVVAPDQALLVGEHGAPPRLPCLRLRNPFRRLAGSWSAVRPVMRAASSRLSLVGRRPPCRSSLVEALDEGLVGPSLVGDVSQPRIEQREIGAGVDGKVHHAVLAGLDLAGIDGHRTARVDDDDTARARPVPSRTRPSSCPSNVPRRFGTQWFRK